MEGRLVGGEDEVDFSSCLLCVLSFCGLGVEIGRSSNNNFLVEKL